MAFAEPDEEILLIGDTIGHFGASAYLAGLAVGFWSDRHEIAANWNEERRFEPQLESAERAPLWAGWRRAVAASRGWADPARRDVALRDHSRQDA